MKTKAAVVIMVATADLLPCGVNGANTQCINEDERERRERERERNREREKEREREKMVANGEKMQKEEKESTRRPQKTF